MAGRVSSYPKTTCASVSPTRIISAPALSAMRAEGASYAVTILILGPHFRACIAGTVTFSRIVVPSVKLGLFFNLVTSGHLRHFAKHCNDRTITGCGKFDGSRYGLRINVLAPHPVEYFDPGVDPWVLVRPAPLHFHAEAADLLAFLTQDRDDVHSGAASQSLQQQAMGLGTGAHAAHGLLGIKVHAKAVNFSDKVHTTRQGGRGRFHLLILVLCFHARSPYQHFCNTTFTGTSPFLPLRVRGTSGRGRLSSTLRDTSRSSSPASVCSRDRSRRTRAWRAM